jgi:hypothetical protein
MTERCDKAVAILEDGPRYCELLKDHAGTCGVSAETFMSWGTRIGGGGGSKPKDNDPIPISGGGGWSAYNGFLMITPRDAFEGGFDAGSNWGLSLDQEAPTPFEKAAELAWEHFQAERMKAAADEIERLTAKIFPSISYGAIDGDSPDVLQTIAVWDNANPPCNHSFPERENACGVACPICLKSENAELRSGFERLQAENARLLEVFAWEHFQAKRMKAAASTEDKCDE